MGADRPVLLVPLFVVLNMVSFIGLVSGNSLATVQPLIWLGTALALLLALLSKYIYRLTLHPLAQFPGPRLAAATNLYGAYIDLGTSKSYTKSFPALHDQFGPTPNRLSSPSTANLTWGRAYRSSMAKPATHQ